MVLRWQLQRGIVCIPKSTKRDRMEQNFDVFDFTLSQRDMDAIAALDTGVSSFFDHRDPAVVEMLAGLVRNVGPDRSARMGRPISKSKSKRRTKQCAILNARGSL